VHIIFLFIHCQRLQRCAGLGRAISNDPEEGYRAYITERTETRAKVQRYNYVLFSILDEPSAKTSRSPQRAISYDLRMRPISERCLQ